MLLHFWRRSLPFSSLQPPPVPVLSHFVSPELTFAVHTARLYAFAVRIGASGATGEVGASPLDVKFNLCLTCADKDRITQGDCSRKSHVRTHIEGRIGAKGDDVLEEGSLDSGHSTELYKTSTLAYM